MDYIHETIIRDLIDLGSDLKDLDALKAFEGRNSSMKSISSASAGLIAVFPVLCSKNVSPTSASMLTKAIERDATTMLQMIFAARQVHTKDDLQSYLKQFHTNLRLDDKVTVDGIMDIVSMGLKESHAYNSSEQESFIRRDMRNINHVLEDNINETAISNYYVKPGKNGVGNRNTVLIGENIKFPLLPLTVADLDKTMKEREKDARERANDQYAYNKDQYERRKADSEDKKFALAKAKFDNDLAKQDRETYGNNIKDLNGLKGIYSKQLMDNDVKKANELLPSLMSVNVIVDKGDGKTPYPISFVIGVKAKLHTISSKDAIERLVSKQKDSNVLNKFIRATTREISFFKDFLFAIDQAKVDALSQSRRGSSSKLWKILERRAKKSAIRRKLGMKNDATAITTFGITQDEVEFIKKEYNINLDIPEVIRPIMEAYNLMTFCILDEANEVAKFIRDTGEDIYEEIAFSSLERETSDGGYKKAINLISKMTR